MKDQDKTNEELINELESLRRRVAELEESEAGLKGTERLLRESEERFRLLYENAPLGYQSLDEKGSVLEVNQAWLETLGYSRGEVIGKWFGDFLASGYQERFNVNFPKFMAAGEIHWVEFEMVRKDGNRISVAFDGQIGRDQQGRFRQTHCILHDITDLKRTEEALRESEESFRLIVEGAADSIFVQVDGRFSYLNGPALRLFRVDSREDLLGKPVMDRFHPGFHETVRELVRLVLVEKKRYRLKKRSACEWTSLK